MNRPVVAVWERRFRRNGRRSALAHYSVRSYVPRSEIPAVTHVDYSARIQTVHRDTNPTLPRLAVKVQEKDGMPVIVNTSFNVRGEPIVGSPEDAFRCFVGTGIETLAVGNCLLRKENQDPALKLDYKESFELD